MTTQKRKPWIAGLLSLFWPSLGHLYVGAAQRGLILLAFLYSLMILAGWLGLYTTSFWGSIWGTIGLSTFFFIFWMAIVDDAIRLAKLRQEFILKKYNKWYVYVVVAIAITTLQNLVKEQRGKLLGVESYRIVARSMSPTLKIGDFIFVDTRYYKDKPPQRGEVIVFRYPENPSIPYVERLIAVAGDHVSIKNGTVYINNNPLAEPYLLPQQVQQSYSTTMENRIIPPDELFVLGDNRDNSKDSRYWGNVPLANLIGKVTYIWLSTKELNRIGSVVK
jgi:signal peptidase I